MDEIKDYLYDSLSKEQLTDLSKWIDYLKKNGPPKGRHEWVGVKIEIFPCSCNTTGNVIPDAVYHVLSKEQKEHYSLGEPIRV